MNKEGKKTRERNANGLDPEEIHRKLRLQLQQATLASLPPPSRRREAGDLHSYTGAQSSWSDSSKMRRSTLQLWYPAILIYLDQNIRKSLMLVKNSNTVRAAAIAGVTLSGNDGGGGGDGDGCGGNDGDGRGKNDPV